MLWQFHRQLIRGHCSLLLVSKETVYQSTKDHWYTACIVLNSSNSRYFISEFLFFRVILNKETSESFAYIHRGHLETSIKKLPATSIREEPVAGISVWDKWRTLVYHTAIWAYGWSFACQLREDSPCTWLCRGYDGINRQTTVFKSWRNGQDYNED